MGGGAQPADIGVALERQRTAKIDTAAQIGGDQGVLGVVGGGEHRPALAVQQVRRHRSQPAQIGRPEGDPQAEIDAFAARRQIGITLEQPGRRVLAPTVVGRGRQPGIDAQVTFLAALLHRHPCPTERTAAGIDPPARTGNAVLHAQGDGAALGVQSEHRIGAGNHLDASDREAGRHVPVHQIAEGLVQAHAVLIDRQPLGIAQHRRGVEAAKAQIGLQRIALIIGDRHRAKPGVEHLRHRAGRPIPFPRRVHHLDIARHPVQFDAGPQQRRHPHHHHLGQSHRFFGPSRRSARHQQKGGDRNGSAHGALPDSKFNIEPTMPSDQYSPYWRKVLGKPGASSDQSPQGLHEPCVN